MISIGQRLKESRDSTNMNQTQFGAIGGVGQRAQINYEKGDRSPSAEYLSKISKIPNIDIQYIITGMRSINTLSDSELELFNALKNSNHTISTMAIASALGVINSAKAQKI